MAALLSRARPSSASPLGGVPSSPSLAALLRKSVAGAPVKSTQLRELHNASAAAAFSAAPAGSVLPFPIHAPAARREHVLNTVRQQVPLHRDAFYVVDLSEVAHKYAEWRTQVPRARPFYAVKCNDDPKVVATLARLGSGFDCASKAEMAMVLAEGVNPKDIIFAHPAKQPTHLAYARSKGVTKMTFDNEDELEKIAVHHPEAELVLRILADDSHSVCRLGLKFGAPLDRVPGLISRAKELGLNVIGISYHVGSGNGNAASFADAVRDARKAFDMAAAQGMKLSLLDIGGGFPGSEMGVDLDAERAYSHSSAAAGAEGDAYASHPSFRAIASHVRAALDTHFPAGCGVNIISEPGRFFVKSTHTLAVNVVAKRRTVDEDSGRQRINYYVNDGLYGSFNCVLYDHASAHPNLVLAASDTPSARLVAREPEMDLVKLAETVAVLAPTAGPADDAVAMLGADGKLMAAEAVGLLPAVQLAQTVAEAQEQQQVSVRRMRMGGSDEDGSEGVSLSAAGGAGASSGSSVSVSRAASVGGGSSAAGSAAPAHSRGMRTFSAAPSAPSFAGAAGTALGGSVPLFHTTIWGPTCDSIDKISDSTLLPELHAGDWLVYENMGAYTIAGSCRFNGFPLATKVYIHTDGRIEAEKEATE